MILTAHAHTRGRPIIGKPILARALPLFIAGFTLAIVVGFIVGEIALRPKIRPAVFAPSMRARMAALPQAERVAAAFDSRALLPMILPDHAGPQVRTHDPQAPTPLAVVQLVDAAAAIAPALAAPASTPPSSPSPVLAAPGPRVHVQVGFSDDRSVAEALAAGVRDRGYAVHLIGGPPYQVWVGGYVDDATARRLAARLSAEGFQPTLMP